MDPAGVTVPLRPGETILAGLHRAGYAYRVGCRRGGCGACAAAVTSGAVRHTGPVAETALPAADRAAGSCLTCRAVPEGDVVIELAADARFRCVSPLLADLAGAESDCAGRDGSAKRKGDN